MNEHDFERVAREYAGRLYAVAYRMLGNRADAEDAVQRALLKCFAARASYSARWAVSTWLYRALTNVCIDELRRRRVRTVADLGPGAGSGAVTTPNAQGRRRRELALADGEAVARQPRIERIDLTRALDTVPREARLLLALHYVDGLGYGELAKIRGISINTVKSQLKRGKAIMKKALEAGGHDGSD
ncbi:MAG TPA: sigma-70 family RNA polymerase sigma factor [Methylomirabilota bacterium]